jgi:hypothetical protein
LLFKAYGGVLTIDKDDATKMMQKKREKRKRDRETKKEKKFLL